MIQQLPLRVEPMERETLPSYFSRMAAINGTSASDFAVDLGFSFKRILNQEEVALDQFSRRAGLPADRLTSLLSWTGERIGNVRMRFRGEVFISRSLRNPVVRGCPLCIREEAQEHPSPLRYTSIKGDWQLRGAEVCLQHRHPLVSLWSRQNLFERYDIGARMTEVLPDILAGELDRPEARLSPYDLWLDRRLSKTEDETWLAAQPLFSAMTFCNLLGAELIRTDIKKAPKGYTQDQAANTVGFETAARGPAAIRDSFYRLAEVADGALDEPQKAFGQLYVSLNRAYKAEKSFDGFRAILRDCILDVWPIAPNDEVLGRVTPHRRLHSVLTASKEVGVGVQLLDSFLTEAGAFAEGDVRPPSRKTFDAQQFSNLLDEIPHLIGPKAMRGAIGATRNEMEALENDGVLVPRTRLPAVKSPWRAADGEALIAQLARLSTVADPRGPDWQSLQLARKRIGIPISALIAFFEDRSLTLGKRPDVFGYHGFVVRRSELDRLVLPAETDLAAPLHGLSAAEFGRTVGLRSKGHFLALVEAGHTPATEVLHPKTGQKQKRMSKDDVAAFHEKFVTLTTLSFETGQHRNAARALIKAAGIKAFSPEGQGFGSIYLRKTVAPLIAKLRL